jgi:DNA mismatch endonuclease, patch repair protein
MERDLRKRLPKGRFLLVPPARSKTMRAIRGSGNRTTEMRLRSALVRLGLRGWLLHPQAVPGHPDLVFPRPKLAIFVDGCFWHGCPTCGHVPKTNRAFWEAKIAGNRRRDVRNAKVLRRRGYSVLRIREHDLQRNAEACVSRVVRSLRRLKLSR